MNNNISMHLSWFKEAVKNPDTQLKGYLQNGDRVIGCFPYYVPEELVHAAGMIPFGIWGFDGTVNLAKEYFPPFYCTIAQMGLEMALQGRLDGLSGVIIPSLCDTLRPLSQNFRVAVPQIPFMFLAHPQNRKPAYGIEYARHQFDLLRSNLEEIIHSPVEPESIKRSIGIYNQNRALRRRFVLLAGAHPDAVSPSDRNAVLKSAYFLKKEEHSAHLSLLCDELESMPVVEWAGIKVVTSGIIADNKDLLTIFETRSIAVAADDVAQESRSFRVDVPDAEDPMTALALWFSLQDDDTILYSEQPGKRAQYVADLVRQSGADGVVVLMMQFCDPEEMEYPSLKQTLEKEGIPHVQIWVDQQIQNLGQANTQLETLVHMLKDR